MSVLPHKTWRLSFKSGQSAADNGLLCHSWHQFRFRLAESLGASTGALRRPRHHIFCSRLKASVHDAASLLSQLKISSAAFSRSETAQSCGRRCVKGQKTLQPHQNVYFVLLSVSFRRICVSLAEREGAEHSELDRQDASTPYPSTGDTCVTERLSAAFPGLSKLRQLYAFLSWFWATFDAHNRRKATWQLYEANHISF